MKGALQQGLSLIESSLVIPLLMTLLLFFADFVTLYREYSFLSEKTSDVARVISTEFAKRVEAATGTEVSAPACNLSVYPFLRAPTNGDYRVKTQYYDKLIPSSYVAKDGMLFEIELVNPVLDITGYNNLVVAKGTQTAQLALRKMVYPFPYIRLRGVLQRNVRKFTFFSRFFGLNYDLISERMLPIETSRSCACPGFSASSEYESEKLC